MTVALPVASQQDAGAQHHANVVPDCCSIASSCQQLVTLLMCDLAAECFHNGWTYLLACMHHCLCRLLGLTQQHIAAELSTGKVYTHHHPDVKGRPVFVIRTCRHVQGKQKIRLKKQSCKHTLNNMLQQLGICLSSCGVVPFRAARSIPLSDVGRSLQLTLPVLHV